MTPITIKGIQLESLSIDIKDERKVTGHYNLISSLDKVLAKQTIGGYQGVELVLSTNTQIALDQFIQNVKNDLNNTLGIPTE